MDRTTWIAGAFGLLAAAAASVGWGVAQLPATPVQVAEQHPQAMPQMAPSPVMAPRPAEAGQEQFEGYPLITTNAALTPDPGGKIVPIALHAKEVRWPVAADQTIVAWTFDGQVPGPALRVREGDVVEFTLVNQDSHMAHSMDFHSAITSPSRDYVSVAPGTAGRFYWKAERAGVYMYHCGSAPVLMHIAMGGYGAIVVDPKSAFAPAREYVLVQSEMFAQPDMAKMTADQPDWIVFNGQAHRYTGERALTAKPGELVRLYVVDVGPNEFSAFHVVGTIFDRAYANGSPKNVQYDMQTVTIPPGGSYTVEFRANEPGDYAVVTHAFRGHTLGAMATLHVAADAPELTGLMPFVQPVAEVES